MDMSEVKEITNRITAPLFNSQGEKTGESFNLNPKIFGQKPNTELMSQAVLVALANQRLGTAKAKTRGEVLLTGKKMYKQKHTGRARHGAASAPIFVGGGVAHGPKPGKRVKHLSEKMRRLAFIFALSQKFKEGKISILEKLVLAKTKTKEAGLFIKKISPNKKVLILLGNSSQEIGRSFANLKQAKAVLAQKLDVVTLLKYPFVLVEKGALPILAKRLLGKNAS